MKQRIGEIKIKKGYLGGMVLLALSFVSGSKVEAQIVNKSTVVSTVSEMPEGEVQTRWYTPENVNAEKGAGGRANFGRKGSACFPLEVGETTVLADIEGSGTIRRMWIVLFKRDAKALRGLRLQMFWDGEEKPAVDVPLGDFFCQSHGEMSTFENVFFSSPEGRSFNCFVEMPFRKNARIQIINESDVQNWIYYEINTTVNEVHSKNKLYFHSSWRRENPTTMREDFAILPKIKGKGRFLGCHLGLIQSQSMKHCWWGEGEYKVYLDGDTELPTLCGTGTEDLVGTGYGQGKFDHLYQGNQYLSKGGVAPLSDAHGYYRFHVPDPIYFYNDIRVEIQVMGSGTYGDFLKAMDKDPELRLMKPGEAGIYWTREELEKLNPTDAVTVERVDDHFATAYWYMDRPANTLLPLAPYAQRIKGLEKDIDSLPES